MEFLYVLLDPILPIFAIMALGFVLGRTAWVSVDEARTVNRITLTVLLPIFLFDVSSHTEVSGASLLPILTYLIVELIVFLFGFALAFRVFRRSASESVLLAMAGVIANNVFYVLPIAIGLYGPAGAQPFVLISAVDGLVGFSVIILALEFIRQGKLSFQGLGRAIFRSPIILALLAGMGFAATGWVLPQSFITFMDFNGAAAAPLALFALGVVLSRTRFKAEPVVALFVGIKVLLFPACVWAALQLMSYEAADAPIYVLSAAGPSVAMSFSLALLYNVKTDLIAQVMVWTGVFSLVSIVVLA